MPSAAEWFQKGLAAVHTSRSADYRSERARDLAEAIEAFDQALALEPAHLRALEERGLAQALLGHHEAALDSFVAASVQAPQNANLRLAIAHSLAKLGQQEAAVSAFEEVLHVRPDDSQALFGRAESLMALRRNELAVAAWNAVLRGPDVARLHVLLSQALALGRLGRAEARGCFRDVFDAHAVQLAGPLAPAVFHEALRELEVARCAYRAHLETNSGDALSWGRAAQVWQAVHNTCEAIAAWDSLVTHPPDAHAWFGKAEAGHLDSLEYWPGFLAAPSRSAG